MNASKSPGLARSVPRVIAQILIWPVLGFLTIAFDDLGPRLVTFFAGFVQVETTFTLPAGSDLYAFLQWGLLTPLVVWLSFRFPLLDRRAKSLVVHVVAALLLLFVRSVFEPKPWTVRTEASVQLAEPPSRARAMSRDLLVYLSIAGAAHLYVFARRRSKAEKEALAAQASLAEARRALFEQTVSPELIIRSLDEIARRIREEPARVEVLVDVFSEFLRSRIPQSRGSEDRPARMPEQALERELGGMA